MAAAGAGIVEYEPGDLTVVAEAGLRLSELRAALEPHRQWLSLDPPGDPTLGECLLEDLSGPLRHRFGTMRDLVLGVSVVLRDGLRANAGGKVVKNVAGYDLMKLLIGSYGTLAVITSASFKLFPAPRQTRTFLAEFATWQEALKFRDQVVRSPLSPMCLEIVSPQARKLLRPEMTEDAWVICVRAAGSDAVLARYHKELGAAVTRELEGEDERQMWSVLEQFPFAPNAVDANAHRTCSLFAPPSELGEIFQIMQDFLPGGMACIGRVGLGHLLIAAPANDDAGTRSLESLKHRLPISVQVMSSWGALDAMPGMRAVKQALDPNNVMRGRELS